MISVFLKHALLFLLLLAAAGCMNFDYVGQTFDGKGDSAVVNIIKGRQNIPADQYRIIGRGVLTGPVSTDDYDRLAELRSQARRHGADAVCIVKESVKAVGYYPRSDGAFAPPLSAKSNMDNLNSRGEAWETDSFGQVTTFKGRERVRYEFEIQGIFLKKKKDVDAEMKTRTPFL